MTTTHTATVPSVAIHINGQRRELKASPQALMTALGPKQLNMPLLDAYHLINRLDLHATYTLACEMLDTRGTAYTVATLAEAVGPGGFTALQIAVVMALNAARWFEDSTDESAEKKAE